jgi:hypothetical protein
MENATRTRRDFLRAAGMAGMAGWAAHRAGGHPLAPGVQAARPRQKIILDVDTGTDDAVALMFGALHPDLELVAATTVNGNVGIEFTTENTLRVFDHIGVKIPVYRGMASPIVRSDFPEPRTGGSAFHGQYLDLPPSRSRVQENDAVDFLIATVLAGRRAADHPGPGGPALQRGDGAEAARHAWSKTSPRSS